MRALKGHWGGSAAAAAAAQEDSEEAPPAASMLVLAQASRLPGASTAVHASSAGWSWCAAVPAHGPSLGWPGVADSEEPMVA